jgi:type IV pilus assembly protein PilW
MCLIKRQSGLSLIELMVAMAVTLLLVVVASSAYLSTRGTYRTTDEQSQLYEEGRFALDILGRSIRQAGYVSMNRPNIKELPNTFREAYSEASHSQVRAIFGCEAGFDPATMSCPVSANALAPDAFSVSYVTDESPANPGMGRDCLGNGGPSVPAIVGGTVAGSYLVTNWYYLKTDTYDIDGATKTISELMCRGSASATPQPLFRGVVDLQLEYGIQQTSLISAKADRITGASAPTVNYASAPDTTNAYASRYVKANNSTDLFRATNLNASPKDDPDGWDNVTSVRLCLVMETVRPTNNPVAPTYRDCGDVERTAPQGYVRRAFRSVIQIRARSEKTP